MQHRIRRHQCHPIENELDTVREAPVFQTLPLSSGIERLAALYALRMIEGARLQSKLYAQRVLHHDFDVLNLTGLALKDHRPDGMTLGEVPVEGEKREPVSGPERFRAFSLAQALLAREPGQLLLFDEVEDVFGNGFSSFLRELFGRGRNAPTTKGWINETLETNPVPTLWVCNDITAMDPAYLRRFGLVAEFRAPTERVRRRIVQRCFPEGTLSRDGIQALTAMESLHLAVKWLRSGRLSLPTTGCCESELNPPPRRLCVLRWRTGGRRGRGCGGQGAAGRAQRGGQHGTGLLRGRPARPPALHLPGNRRGRRRGAARPAVRRPHRDRTLAPPEVPCPDLVAPPRSTGAADGVVARGSPPAGRVSAGMARPAGASRLSRCPLYWGFKTEGGHVVA